MAALVCRASLCPLLLLALLAACGDGSSGDSERVGQPVRFQPAASGVTAFGDVPWPSDLHRDDSGAITAISGLDRLVSQPAVIERGLTGSDGFGRASGGLFFVDAEVDAASLPRQLAEAEQDDAAVLLVDLDDTADEIGRRYPVLARPLPSLGCISAIPFPGVVLRPGARHALVLTVRARAATGESLVADDELARIATLSADERISRVERLYGDALDRLVAYGAVRRKREVAGLAVFTTSARVGEMAGLRQRLRQLPEPQLLFDPAAAAPYTTAIFGIAGAPTLDQWLGFPERDEHGREWPGSDNPGGIAHDSIAVIASGAMVAPSFLDRSSGHFESDASGAVVLANATAKIPVTLMLPRSAAPAAGYPVVIHGHGLSNHRGSLLGIANELARAGFAMIAIDDVQHGARQGIRDNGNNYGGVYRGPDGIPDAFGLPIAFFAGFGDFLAIRDNFRQSVLDHSSVVRLIQNPELDLTPLTEAAGGVTPRLDGERIFWSGGSLGGMMGTMVSAVEPEIDAAALQVPGGNFMQLITTNSAEVAPLVSTIARTLLGIRGDEVIDEFHPVANVLAIITEPGDPIAYAPHVLHNPSLSGRGEIDVLLTYAVGDEVMPNVATIALIRALGLELATPHLHDLDGVELADSPVVDNLPGGQTAAAVQYLPANHNLGYSRFDTRRFEPGVPHPGPERFPLLPEPLRFEQPVREHADQLVGFFTSIITGGPAHIEVTAPPHASGE
ncbi:MAG TPA: hypothetical protein VEB21_00375 [Terriglobales bacterium]|nr:hypothetical protein [Terriglobales bacterium]